MSKTKDNGMKKTIEPYFIVSRKAAQDETLSGDALAALTYLLSKPDGWIIRTADVKRRFGWGRAKTQKALKELRDHYYIVTEMTKDENNRFAGKQDHIYSSPKDPAIPVSGNTENEQYGKLTPLNNKEGLDNKELYIGDTSQNGTASIDDIHHSGVARANEVNSIVSLVNNSTSTDGMTLQDIANVYPYSISEIRIMCQQANKDGLIAFDGVTEKAYRLTDYSKPVVRFEDLKRPDEWTFTPKHSTKQDDIKDAVIHAFGWDANKLTDNEHGLAGKAAKQLSQAGVYADEVSALYEYCQRFDNITPMALCNHVNNWRTASTKEPASMFERSLKELGI